MTRLCISLATLAACAIGAALSPASATETSALQCSRTWAQYSEYAKWLAPLAERARHRADENPLYESDAQYYAAELADAQQCIKNLSPITTAAR
jgi:hypothetical protein